MSHRQNTSLLSVPRPGRTAPCGGGRVSRAVPSLSPVVFAGSPPATGWAPFLRGDRHRVDTARNCCCGRWPGFRVCKVGMFLLFYCKEEKKRFSTHIGEHLHNVNHLLAPKGLVHGWVSDRLREVAGPHFSCCPLLLLELQGR